LKPSGGGARDAEFSSAYVSLLYSLTGEPFVVSEGVMKPFYPKNFFNPGEGQWGAFVLGLRGEHFEGDEDWIMPDAFVSVGEADAVSAVMNWIPYPMLRMILDYTYTDFSDPIRVRVDPDGSVDYVEKESVLTVRLSMDF
jgi:phosphate-selective porin